MATNVHHDQDSANRRLGLILFGIFLVLTVFAVSFILLRSRTR